MQSPQRTPELNSEIRLHEWGTYMSNEQILASELYTQALFLAEDPSTEPQLLEQLSADTNPLVRRAVAQNPNTPLSVLAVLSAAHPKEILQNPSLPLLFLEDPNFLLRFPEEGLLKMLSSKDFPREYLSLLTRHPSAKVQLQLALSPKLPSSFLQGLLKNDSLARLLAEHPRTPSSTLYLLLGHNDYSIRSYAAKHPNAPKRLLSLFRFLGVDPLLHQFHPSLPLMRRLLSAQEERLLAECGPFGASLLFFTGAKSSSTRRKALRYCRIGREQKGMQSSYWRGLASFASR
jgi:hypothetical protein